MSGCDGGTEYPRWGSEARTDARMRQLGGDMRGDVTRGRKNMVVVVRIFGLGEMGGLTCWGGMGTQAGSKIQTWEVGGLGFGLRGWCVCGGDFDRVVGREEGMARGRS